MLRYLSNINEGQVPDPSKGRITSHPLLWVSRASLKPLARVSESVLLYFSDPEAEPVAQEP